MSGIDVLTTAQTAAMSELTAVVNLQQQYTLLQNPQSRNMQELDDLNTEIQDKQDTLRGLQLAEQTYSQEYLDRKAGPAQGGFFTRLGMGNAQDWSITIFYGSYVLLVFALLVSLVQYSTEKIKLIAAISMTAIIIGILMTRLLFYFG